MHLRPEAPRVYKCNPSPGGAHEDVKLLNTKSLAPLARFVACLSLLICGSASGAPPRKLVVGGSSESPPHSYLDDKGRPSGFNVELMRSLARAAGIDVEFRMGSRAQVMAEFEAGKIDLMNTIASPERKANFDLLFQTWNVRYVMAFRSGRDRYPTRVDQLADETVAVPARSAIHEMIEALPSTQRPSLRLTGTLADAMSALIEGKATVAVGSELTMEITAARLGDPKLVKVPMGSLPYYLVTQKGRLQEFGSLIEQFERLRKNGEYARMVEQHLTVLPRLPLWQRYAQYSGAGALGLLLILLGVMLWNRSLRRRVNAALAERDRQQSKLLESQHQYEAMVNSVNGVVWEADPQTFAFTFVSPEAEHLLGYPTEQWVREPNFCVEHLHPEDREWAPAYCAHLTAALQDHVFDYRMIDAGGRTVWIRNLVRVIVEDGRAVALRGLMIDITDRKAAEQELEAARQAADAANRAKSQFLANMSHEIRTPMNGVMGMASLLLETDLSADQRDYAATIQSSGDALLKIIDDVLDFSRIEAGKVSLHTAPFDLEIVLREVANTVAWGAFRKGLRFSVQYPDQAP